MVLCLSFFRVFQRGGQSPAVDSGLSQEESRGGMDAVGRVPGADSLHCDASIPVVSLMMAVTCVTVVEMPVLLLDLFCFSRDSGGSI